MASVSLTPGQLFGGDFRIERELSEGGMGVVYVARQESTGVRRALKVMQPQLVLARDPEKARRNQERFIAEARIGATIQSEHVVQVITAGIDPATGAPWFAMELLEGETLEQELTRRGPFSVPEVLAVFEQLCHALSAAHAAGVFHLDLKPENIFRARVYSVARASTIKVLDFGIARIVSEHQRSTQLTQAIGTPYWMSPEQASRNKVSGATDVWSLGLIAFRLLTGRHYWREANRPEGESTLMAWLLEMTTEPLVPASERARALGVTQPLPPGFDGWFSRCVDRDRERRFQGAAEAWSALQTALGTIAPASVAPTRPMPLPVSVEPTLRTTSPMAFDVVPGGSTAAHRAGDGALGRWTATQRALVGVGAFVVVALAAVALSGALTRPPPDRTPAGAPEAGSIVVTPPATPPATGPRCPDGMVPVTGGTFQLNDVAQATVSAFCIDRTEVTTARYAACVAANRCTPANESYWEGGAAAALADDQRRCTMSAPSQGDHPINCVTWDMAERYCLQRGAEVPTESQWEFAARGATGNRFPWGADPPTPLRVNGCGPECFSLWNVQASAPRADEVLYLAPDPWPTTAPVESPAGDRSTFGALGMAGNVAEWTRGCEDLASSATLDPALPRCVGAAQQNIARGGAWDRIEAAGVSALARVPMALATQRSNLGFRCASRPLAGT